MVMRAQDLDGDGPSDSRLAERAARGNTDAFSVLYRRHAEASWRVALAVTGDPQDAADAVTDAFTGLIGSMADGRVAPSAAFRPYLLVATRNSAVEILQRHQHLDDADLEVIDLLVRDQIAASESGDPVLEAAEASIVGRAFRRLPERWRSVLWMTDVEGVSVDEVATRMGLSVSAAKQLELRARNGLRERYLQTSLADDVTSEECRETVSLLGAYVAGALSSKAIAQVDQHLAACGDCRGRLEEIEDVGAQLRRIALPIPLALGSLALERFRQASSGAHAGALGVGGASAGHWLVGSARSRRLAKRLVRPMAGVSTTVFALGMIAAAVLNDGGTIAGTPNSRPSALPPGGGTNAQLLIFPPALAATWVAPAGHPIVSVPVRNVAAAVASAIPTRVVSAHPTTTPGVTVHTPPAVSAPATPTLQVTVGVNLGSAGLGAGVGLGSGACNGVDSSCSAPPKKAGAGITVITPVGTLKI